MSSIAGSSSGSTGDYLSGQISFAGLGSGTDFQGMIDQLKKIESIPKNRLEKWKADWQLRVDGFDALLKGMSDLSKQLSSMDSISTFLSKVVSSTSSNVAKAEAAADAPQGSYKITVNKLATNGLLSTKDTIGRSKTDPIVPLGSEYAFSYSYGKDKDGNDQIRELKIPGGTSLQNFVNIINNDTMNPGVNASLIKSTDGYILQMQGKSTGADNQLEILTPASGNGIPGLAPNTDPDEMATSNLWYNREAQDAEFYLEGRSTQVLKSASNSLTEVIGGLTVTLTDVGSTTLTVTNDAGSAKKKITEFVDGLNTLLKQFNDLTKVDSKKETSDPVGSNSQYSSQKGSILTGNYGVQLLSANLKNICVGKGVGFNYPEGDGTGDLFAALSYVGISMDADESSPTYGQMVIAQGESEPGSPHKTLDEALKEDPEAVAMLFAADNVPECTSPNFSFVSQDKKFTQPGSHSIKYDVVMMPSADGSGTLVPTPSNVTINGKPASCSDPERWEFTATDGSAKFMSIRIENLTPGSYDGTVNIKQGKITQLNTMLKAENQNVKVDSSAGVEQQRGALHVLRDNYADIMKNIDLKIAKEEDRLAQWETRMRLQFSRLDALLATYNQQLEANASALGSAGSKSK